MPGTWNCLARRAAAGLLAASEEIKVTTANINPSTHGRVHVNFKKRYANYIGGQWTPPTKGEYFENVTPVTGHVRCEIPRSGADDIEAALDTAHVAKAKWGRTSAAERAGILNKIADRLEANLDYLATVETWDNGKPIRETTAADLPLAIDHFRYFAGCVRSQEGSIAEIDEDTVAYHYHEPLGVVAQIIPWNFPILMATWKLAPALAAGNCVVLSRPSRRRCPSSRSWSSSPTCCRRACSTSSTASASRRASHSPPTSASPRWRSPVRRPPAG